MRFTIPEKSTLYTELAKLLGAGFPMDNALAALEHHPLPPGSRHYVRSVQRHLQAGRSIADSVAAIDGIEIDGVERHLIHAGERSGHLAEVFEHLSSYFQRLHQARRSVMRGLLYPAVLLHVAVLLLALPNVVAGGGLGAWQPAITTLLLAYALAALVGFTYRFLHQQAAVLSTMDRVLIRVPVTGGLRRSLAMERFTEVFRIYLLSAFKPSDAIAAAGEASQSGYLREQSSIISKKLADGNERLGELLMASDAFPKDFAAGMSTAEASGTLDKELLRWSNYYAGRTREAFARVEIWLPKIVYVAVAAYVVWQIVSWYLGYFDSVMSLL